MYFPQFHPIPENDRLWGTGFTEWTHVSRARPLFPGHRQPNLPSDLGFYDLRLPAVRESQANLARHYGLHGFCFWYYWFAGCRVMHRPLDDVLATGRPDFPFMVGWCNQSWTGVWYGRPGETLIRQDYPGDDDHRAHFERMLPFFLDRRYIRVDGRPAMYLTRPQDVPDLGRFVELWNELARRNGLDGLFFMGQAERGVDLTGTPLDAYVRHHGPYLRGERSRPWWHPGPAVQRYSTFSRRLAAATRRQVAEDSRNMPTVVPRWDHTPRTGRRGIVLHDASPAVFGAQAEAVIDCLGGRPLDRRLVFVKSWNEWAEGNYIEPDQRHGHQFLAALGTAIKGAPVAEPADWLVH
jgi:lipopolysaccharide biosynthesis protein